MNNALSDSVARESNLPWGGVCRTGRSVCQALVLSIALPAGLPSGVEAADKEASPGAKVVQVAAGSLVIVGGGLLPEAIRDRFLELAGANARLVVIPTASKRAETGRLHLLTSHAYWSQLATAGKVKSVVFLHTRQPEEANDPAFVKPLAEASAVWFSGGDQSLLTAAYKGTAVEKELRKLLARGGVVGGTSAGAAVMSDLMIRYGNPVAEVGNGFGFLSGIVVDQHFNERKRLTRLLGVLARNPAYLGMGIDEQTGVVVQGECATVLGRRNVRFCLPNAVPTKAEVKVYEPGDRIDLAAFRRIVSATLKPAVTKVAAQPPAKAATPMTPASASSVATD